jgi:hypothetical protein
LAGALAGTVICAINSAGSLGVDSVGARAEGVGALGEGERGTEEGVTETMRVDGEGRGAEEEEVVREGVRVACRWIASSARSPKFPNDLRVSSFFFSSAMLGAFATTINKL